jgi:ABC-2 type transport system ATP-binding protein
MDAVVLEEVQKSFGTVRAVDRLSARVPTGAITGFLGPNGAGKTTTLRMLLDIIRPDAGRIEVLGRSAARLAKDRIGYLPEERGLYRKMKVARLLAYMGAIKGVPKRRAAEQARRWLDRIELGGWAERRVEDLSRGMQQKLQFAVAVINDPELLILDEPFSGLDPVNLDLLEAIILEMRAQGKTIIFSTHAMPQAERLCDHILLINRGRPVLDGTLAEIRARWRAHAAVVELEGDAEFVRGLPFVTGVEAGRNGQFLVRLSESADPQELLKVLVGRVRVLSFAIQVPSLHEIFVKLVGADDASNS